MDIKIKWKCWSVRSPSSCVTKKRTKLCCVDGCSYQTFALWAKQWISCSRIFFIFSSENVEVKSTLHMRNKENLGNQNYHKIGICITRVFCVLCLKSASISSKHPVYWKLLVWNQFMIIMQFFQLNNFQNRHE